MKEETITQKNGGTLIVRWTEHALDRLVQRFVEADKPALIKTIDAAVRQTPLDFSCHEQPKRKWKHPLYRFTVVFQRVGDNGVEILTEWKEGQK